MVLQAVVFNGVKVSGQTLRLFCSESSYKVFPSKSKNIHVRAVHNFLNSCRFTLCPKNKAVTMLLSGSYIRHNQPALPHDILHSK